MVISISPININAFTVHEPCRLDFQKTLKLAHFPAEDLLLVEFIYLFIGKEQVKGWSACR